jgi:hypothetical protein
MNPGATNTMYSDIELINIFAEFYEEHLPKLTHKEHRRLATAMVGFCREEGLFMEDDEDSASFDLGSEEDSY